MPKKPSQEDIDQSRSRVYLSELFMSEKLNAIIRVVMKMSIIEIDRNYYYSQKILSYHDNN